MGRLLPVLFVCSGLMVAGADLPPEVLLLQRVRVKAAQTLTRLPNYTCLQTIQRSVRTGPKKKPQVVDTVRLEVALVNGKELFAWPGSRRFQDTDIRQMVLGGAIGTGSFASLARGVFQTRGPQFEYVGIEEADGQKGHKWHFRVAQMVSGYTLRVGDRQAIVGYHGSFWVDPVSLDLQRLEVFADDIPVPLQLSAASEAIEYARVKVGEELFLLPSLSEMQMTGDDGSASINRTTFGSCRQYSGESTLVFDDPGPDATAPVAQTSLEVPPDVRFDVLLDTEIPVATAAVGDPVIAVLRRPVKITGNIVAPKGAKLRGRVTHLSRQVYNRFQGYDVGLQFTEVEWDNTLASLNARLSQITLAAPQIYTRGNGSQQRTPNEKIMGSIFFVRTNFPVTLPRGMQMTWYSAAAEVGDQQ